VAGSRDRCSLLDERHGLADSLDHGGALIDEVVDAE